MEKQMKENNQQIKKIFKLIGIDILKLICFLILCSVIGLCMAFVLPTFFEFPYYGWIAYGTVVILTILYNYLEQKWNEAKITAQNKFTDSKIEHPVVLSGGMGSKNNINTKISM